MNETRDKDHQMLPVWFFIGLLLLVYGIIISAVGISEYSHPPAVVLGDKHLTLWGGLLLILIGGFYTIRFRPRGELHKPTEKDEK